MDPLRGRTIPWRTICTWFQAPRLASCVIFYIRVSQRFGTWDYSYLFQTYRHIGQCLTFIKLRVMVINSVIVNHMFVRPVQTLRYIGYETHDQLKRRTIRFEISDKDSVLPITARLHTYLTTTSSKYFSASKYKNCASSRRSWFYPALNNPILLRLSR